MTLTFSEITELANTLHNKFATLRKDAEARYNLFSLRREPEIPDDLAREGQVNVLSPLVEHSANSIRADLMMNPTEFVVIPLARDNGKVREDDQTKSDNLERALAVIWNQLNDGRRIDKEIIWHQLVSPFGVMVLESHPLEIPDQGDMDDAEYADYVDDLKRSHIPWSISTPDPMTFSVLMHKGEEKLAVRKYRQVVREVRKTYSKPGADLVLKDKRWEIVEDDTSTEQRKSWINAADDYEDVEMIWLDNGEDIYICAMNLADNEKTGTLIHHCPNPFGRVSAFVVGSNVTPLRDPEDMWMPYLHPLMQAVDVINMIRTIRATASRNVSGPDTYVALDPQTIVAHLTAGKELPREVRWNTDASRLPYMLGEIKERPAHVDMDLDKLEMQWNKEMEQYTPSPFVNVLDPSVIRAATASAILHSAEASLRLYGPLMSAYDSAIKRVMEAIIYDCKHNYDEKLYFYANGEEVAGGTNLKEGALYALNSDSLKFAYRLTVRTRAMTQSQAAAQYDLALKMRTLPDGSPGITTIDDLIEAGNFSDKEGQKRALAKEEMLRNIKPQLQQLALARAMVHIEYETGLPMTPPPPPMDGEKPGGGGGNLPNSAQRMDAPMVIGPEGGSSPLMG